MIMIPLVIMSMADGEDKDFMEQLYRDYHRLMFSTAWKFSKHKASVEDIVSESCIALMNNVKTLQGLSQGELRVYIVTTVKSRGSNYFKKQKREQSRFVDSAEGIFNTTPDQFDLEHKVAIEDELNRVLNALSTLPEKEQQIMRLKYAEDMSDKDIAKIVGLSENSIRTYVRRARLRLLKILYEE